MNDGGWQYECVHLLSHKKEETTLVEVSRVETGE